MAKIATRKAFGDKLAELIVKDERVVAMTADLAKSNMTNIAQKVCPQRHIDVGIAEGNMAAMAAGLAAAGMIPFASSFAVFASGRAFEQIRNSIAYPHMNVKIAATHAGISVGEDGASHQSIEDIALMRALPGMVVLQPCDAEETAAMVQWAYEYEGPVYLRLARLAVESVHDENYRFDPKGFEVIAEGKDTALLATGLLVQEALKAREILKEKGIDAAVINIGVLKPLNEEKVAEVAAKYPVIYTVEEHNIIGGLGSAVAEVLAERQCGARLVRIGMNDVFGESGEPYALLDKYGLSGAKIAERVIAGK